MSTQMIESILTFWFGERPAGEPSGRWFNGGPAFDAEIRERFEGVVEVALNGGLEEWAATPRGRLALLLVLDQFPRNLFRGAARAFAGDPRALTLALDGIARGDDRALPPLLRVFCYLPLEHAEDPVLQDRCVELFTALRGETGPPEENLFDGFLDYARRHREVIARFGRFPHRNAVLGRADTATETAYLAEPGAGF